VNKLTSGCVFYSGNISRKIYIYGWSLYIIASESSVKYYTNDICNAKLLGCGLFAHETNAGVWRDATRSMTGYNIRQEKEKRESQTGKRENDSINWRRKGVALSLSHTSENQRCQKVSVFHYIIVAKKFPKFNQTFDTEELRRAESPDRITSSSKMSFVVTFLYRKRTNYKSYYMMPNHVA
jgi:hypothetical protein